MQIEFLIRDYYLRPCVLLGVMPSIEICRLNEIGSVYRRDGSLCGAIADICGELVSATLLPVGDDGAGIVAGPCFPGRTYRIGSDAHCVEIADDLAALDSTGTNPGVTLRWLRWHWLRSQAAGFNAGCDGEKWLAALDHEFLQCAS